MQRAVATVALTALASLLTVAAVLADGLYQGGYTRSATPQEVTHDVEITSVAKSWPTIRYRGRSYFN